MIKRLRVSRFRSLGKDVTVDFGPLTVLVGQNGAGKSNTIDALVFLAECSHQGLERAVWNRHGIESVRHVGAGSLPAEIALRVEIDCDGVDGSYEVVLGGARADDYYVKREHASVGEHSFTARYEQEGPPLWVGPPDLHLRLDRSSLVLPLLAGDERFSPVAQALASVERYTISPEALRPPQPQVSRSLLDRRGENWVSILKNQPAETWRADLIGVLNRLTGDITDIRFVDIPGYAALQFGHERSDSGGLVDWLNPVQESDGTLRVAGIMTAILQRRRPAMLIIEEPELTIHPGALALLYEYLSEASLSGQVVLTTHSPDLLSLADVRDIRVVERIDGATVVASMDDAQRDAVERRLFSLGDVMRSEGLIGRRADPQSEGK